MPTSHYDLAIIGSGQGGTPLAGAFARAGKRTALIERVHVGGTCINEGCTPTKTMVASAYAARVDEPDQLPDAIAKALKVMKEEKRQALVNVRLEASYTKTS